MNNPRWTVTALAAILAASLVLGGAGCASTSDAGDAARRRDLVMVPKDAQPVSSLSWRSVRTITPLNRRMVLFEADRPYLLVLAAPCTGLRRDSVIVNRDVDRVFQPRIDRLEIQDPQRAGLTNRTSTWIDPRFMTSANMLETISCRPDTLYAIRDEDVDDVRAAVDPSRREER